MTCTCSDKAYRMSHTCTCTDQRWTVNGHLAAADLTSWSAPRLLGNHIATHPVFPSHLSSTMLKSLKSHPKSNAPLESGRIVWYADSIDVRNAKPIVQSNPSSLLIFTCFLAPMFPCVEAFWMSWDQLDFRCHVITTQPILKHVTAACTQRSRYVRKYLRIS